MAGAGYKLFNTGDVLTAAQVNTYLMEQTVMVFADAAARTTALSGVVSEGMISYLKDTNAVEVYNGSARVASDDPNAIQNTIVDAKGDLIAASAADTPARLAVGNNGENLVADSGATTGLRWQGNFAVGKNIIINGDFRINQRNFTSNTTSGSFNFDRFYQLNSGGTTTVTPQTFTLGAAPVSGYEGTNFVQIVTSGQSAAGDYAIIGYSDESVRNMAGKTFTFSFWAKATSGTPSVTVEADQNFGNPAASAPVQTTIGKVTLSTSWARYTVTGTIPSISGKTIAGDNDCTKIYLWVSAGSNWNSRTSTLGIQNNTFQFWGIQVEQGNVATAFQTATGTLAGELAACQRYYWRAGGDAVYQYLANGSAVSSTDTRFVVPNPVTMRVASTSVDFSTLAVYDVGGAAFYTITGVTLASASKSSNGVSATVASGLTTQRPFILATNNSTAGYIGFSAEL